MGGPQRVQAMRSQGVNYGFPRIAASRNKAPQDAVSNATDHRYNVAGMRTLDEVSYVERDAWL
jgi:hypothetical protein